MRRRPWLQAAQGWRAEKHKPYAPLGVPVLDFEYPWAMLRAQEAVGESALPAGAYSRPLLSST